MRMGSNCHFHGLEVYRVTLRREFFWGGTETVHDEDDEPGAGARERGG
jgi:hypothetical protein